MSWYRREGEEIAGHVLVAPLGRGGFSEVWRARPSGGVVEVALKLVVHPEHAAQLRSEADALSLVGGPGIVPVLGVRLDEDPPVIFLELLEGGDLRARVGQLGSVEAVSIFERIVEVCARVHREGVVHGDLKPENVLFDRAGKLYLSDFGLSRRISQRSASLSVSISLEDARLLGTLDYMAPEQRAGERPTPRSDVFALGVILYELLTGERPHGVFTMPGERDPSLPPVIDRALASALAPDPTHRFASAGALLGFLKAGLGSDWESLAFAHQRITRILRSDPKERAMRAPIVLGVLVLFLLVIAVAASRRHDEDTQGDMVIGALGLAAGLVLTRLCFRPLLRVIDARRLELARVQEKIIQQIRAESRWTAVREARRAAALAPLKPPRLLSAAPIGLALAIPVLLAAAAYPAAIAAAVLLVGILVARPLFGEVTRRRRRLSPLVGVRRRDAP